MRRNSLATLRPFGFSYTLMLALAVPALAQWYPPNPVTAVSERPDGAELKMRTGVMRLQICSDSIIHVLYSPTGIFPEPKEFVIVKDTWPKVEFTSLTTEKEVALTTARLKLVVDREDSTVVYTDLKKRPLLQEGPKTMEPARLRGAFIYRRRIGMTSGRVRRLRAGRLSTWLRRSTACRFTFARGPSCRWGRVWSGAQRSQPTQSNFESIPARTGRPPYKAAGSEANWRETPHNRID